MASEQPRFRRVGLSNDGTVVFCELDSGSTYAMPLAALERAEDWDERARPESVSIIHDGYAALVAFDTGLKIDFPSDFVVQVCQAGMNKGAGRPMSGVGRRMRQIREARGMTLRELAARTGVAVPNLSRLETDRVTPTFETLRTIAAALDTHPALLVADKKPEHAWIWTRHAFTEWKLGLLWKEGVGGAPVLVRAADMVRVFLATRPEHRYARTRLVRHCGHVPRDPERCKYPLDASKWAREVAAAEAA